jgi:hypothetical protein
VNVGLGNGRTGNNVEVVIACVLCPRDRSCIVIAMTLSYHKRHMRGYFSHMHDLQQDFNRELTRTRPTHTCRTLHMCHPTKRATFQETCSTKGKSAHGIASKVPVGISVLGIVGEL